jgi:pyrimidine operon attenuation protein/uracil phosphoribosyltransferase
MPPKKSSRSLQIDNVYDIIPKSYLDGQIKYDNEKLMNITLPANMLFIGFSGAGKTNLLTQLIKHFETFNKIVIYSKNLDEPIYKWMIDSFQKLEKKMGISIIEAYNNIDSVRPATEYNVKDNTLIIFDDVINETKKMKNILDLFIMGRKNNVTCMFLSQSYFRIPSIIRQNSQYIFIIKLKNLGDLKRILKDNSFDASPELLMKAYNYMRSMSGHHFLLLDGKTNEQELKYRIDFNPINFGSA